MSLVDLKQILQKSSCCSSVRFGLSTAEKEHSTVSLNEWGQNRRCRGHVQVKKNRKAGSKKSAAAQKKKGIGLFAPVNLSPSLAAICGGQKTTMLMSCCSSPKVLN